MAHRWLALFGDFAYTTLLRLNVVVAAVRQRLGLPYWSLSKHAKSKVKNAVAFISRFEEAIAHEAARLGVDGVVCGHIHTAEARCFGDVARSEEHTSELQSLMRISYAVFCLKK